MSKFDFNFSFSRYTIAAKCITWVGRCFLKTALVEFSSKRLASLEEMKIHSSFGSFSVSTTFSIALPTKPLPPVTRILYKIMSETAEMLWFLKNCALTLLSPISVPDDTVSECGVHNSKAPSGKKSAMSLKFAQVFTSTKIKSTAIAMKAWKNHATFHHRPKVSYFYLTLSSFFLSKELNLQFQNHYEHLWYGLVFRVFSQCYQLNWEYIGLFFHRDQ